MNNTVILVLLLMWSNYAAQAESTQLEYYETLSVRLPDESFLEAMTCGMFNGTEHLSFAVTSKRIRMTSFMNITLPCTRIEAKWNINHRMTYKIYRLCPNVAKRFGIFLSSDYDMFSAPTTFLNFESPCLSVKFSGSELYISVDGNYSASACSKDPTTLIEQISKIELFKNPSCFLDDFPVEVAKTTNVNNSEALGKPRNPPESIDWRSHGPFEINYVNSVRNQLQCGACYSFASVAALESHIAIKTEQFPLLKLSRQEIIDCSKDQGNKGCEKGDPVSTYTYIVTYGLKSEDIYGYDGKDNLPCRHKTVSPAAKMARWHQITALERRLLDAIAFTGPLVVSINADATRLTNWDRKSKKIFSQL
ncbi:hypothetical protein L596_010936 [Steinernema carpocapsae]|uniref:Peptidase C1A papain C-terminal domain-containing protein n=1 Tax=Steinernema carpocapsae TaxID=34508 RepID=A0A4V6A727_STECR|nr:hypothetical protein L596_010936 [Steinernema carpocapsae]